MIRFTLVLAVLLLIGTTSCTKKELHEDTQIELMDKSTTDPPAEETGEKEEDGPN